jgi:signal transduction histidine kinase
LEQLLINLLLNAMEAASRDGVIGGSVTVEAAQDHDGQAVLSVKDSGTGPATELNGRMFEPLVTDKPDGTGLGLALVRQIAVEHGGTIDWQRQGELTCFVVRLPAADAQLDLLSTAPARLHG